LRNNLEHPATYAARLIAPHGWNVASELRSLSLEAGANGELVLTATAPSAADEVRRLITAEIQIDGQSQGPISEALVTIRNAVT